MITRRLPAPFHGGHRAGRFKWSAPDNRGWLDPMLLDTGFDDVSYRDVLDPPPPFDHGMAP